MPWRRSDPTDAGSPARAPAWRVEARLGKRRGYDRTIGLTGTQVLLSAVRQGAAGIPASAAATQSEHDKAGATVSGPRSRCPFQLPEPARRGSPPTASN